MRGTRLPSVVVQDYLCSFSGGERVALALARELNAPIFTSLFDSRKTFDVGRVAVHGSWLSRFSTLTSDHRRALPLLAPVFSATRVDAEVTICTTAGWSHGVRARGGLKVAYWESPAKWLHRTADYRAAGTAQGRAAMFVMRAPLTLWDRRAVASVDLHVANSTFTQRQLQAIYGIEAQVIPCPHDFDPRGVRDPVAGLDEGGYLLCVCRLLPYKNVNAVVSAMRRLPKDRLVVVGSGPERQRLEARAPANVKFLCNVSDENLRWLYANCFALVTASREDFGLTPLEAASFGRPSLALSYGGFLDTIEDGVTGVLFETPDPELIADAVEKARSTAWDSELIRGHANQYGSSRFVERLEEAIGLPLGRPA